MGNDVDKNAISVYTAGSIRHNHLLHSESTTSSSSTTTITATLNSSSIFNTNNKVNNGNDNSDFIIDNFNDKYVNDDVDINEMKKSSLHFNKEKYINKNLSSTVVVHQELINDNNNNNAIAITSIPTSNDNNLKSDKYDDVDKSKLVLSKSSITNHNDHNNEISLSSNGSNSSDVIINETITKVEVILSARERYLVRKRKNVDDTV